VRRIRQHVNPLKSDLLDINQYLKSDLTSAAVEKAKKAIEWVHRILEEERDIVISSRPLEATMFEVEGFRMAYVFYESGLSINVMYTVDDPTSGRLGFKLSEGIEVPAELASRFKFATGSQT
jgi:hypothetical protein